MLSDSWFARVLWFLGSDGARSADRPFGQLLAFDAQRAWGLQSPYLFHRMDPSRYPPTHTGHLHQKYSRYEPEWFPVGTRLYAQPNREYQPPEQPSPQSGKGSARRRLPMFATDSHQWTRDLPLQVRAMVVAGPDVFVAGWEDVVGIHKGGVPQPGEPQELAPVLWRLGAEDGKLLSQLELPARPRFDALSAATERLFISLEDGTIMCFGGGSNGTAQGAGAGAPGGPVVCAPRGGAGSAAQGE